MWVKLEYYNPTGSYKDRMALSMIERAEQRGALKPGMTVVEYTGGSTGISLGVRVRGEGVPLPHRVQRCRGREKRRSMEVFGAELEVLKSDGGKLTPDLVPRMMARAREIAALGPRLATRPTRSRQSRHGGRLRVAGRGAASQVQGPIHAFCGAVGTSGMLMGTGRVLKRADPKTRIVALEPATSAVLSGAVPGRHGVEGVAPGFVPPQFDRALVSETRTIDEAEARQMAWTLARQEGLFAGTSTGLNVVAALQLARELGAGKTVVTVAVDSGLKYLAGDLYAQAPA